MKKNLFDLFNRIHHSYDHFKINQLEEKNDYLKERLIFEKNKHLLNEQNRPVLRDFEDWSQAPNASNITDLGDIQLDFDSDFSDFLDID